MATIGEIMAAKGQKFPKIDDTFEETPETQAPPSDDDMVRATLPQADKAQATPTPAMDSPIASLQRPESDEDKLQRESTISNAVADFRTSFRRMQALASLGRQDPNKIDVSDIEAQRNAPLAMYKQRQEAKKAAAQQALEAAHARYFGAEAENIPKKAKLEQDRLDAEIADKRAQAAEATRNHDLEHADRLSAEANALQREREVQAGEDRRNKPFTVTQNPMGLGPTVTNLRTGESRDSFDQNDPRLHDAIEQKQAGAMHVDKDLNATQTHLDDLNEVSNGLATTKGWEPSALEKVGGVIGGPTAVVAGRVADVGRTPEAIQLRNKARMLLQEGLKQGGGVRAAASPQEMKMLQDVYGNPNASPKELKAAIDAQRQIASRHLTKIKGKLPINALAPPSGPAAPAGGRVRGTLNGETKYVDPDRVEEAKQHGWRPG